MGKLGFLASGWEHKGFLAGEERGGQGERSIGRGQLPVDRDISYKFLFNFL